MVDNPENASQRKARVEKNVRSLSPVQNECESYGSVEKKANHPDYVMKNQRCELEVRLSVNFLKFFPFYTMLLNVKENAESLDNSCGKLECRACLENVEKANLIDIFQSWSTEQFSMGVTLADDLCKLTQVQISITDPHSNFICMPCHQKLLDSCIFIAKVQKSQQILNDRYNAMSNKNNWPKPIEVQKNIDSTVLGESTTVEIKQEVISEDEATDFVLNCDNADQLMEIKIEPEEFEEPEIESDVENKTKKPKNEEQALKNEFKHNSIEFTNPVLPMPQNSLPDRISDLMEIKVEPEESVEPLESEIDCETAETQKNQLNVGEDSKNEFNFDNTDSLNHSPVMKVSRDLLPIKITVNGSIPADQFEKIPDMSIDRHVLNGDEVSPEVCVKHEPDSDNDDTEFMNEMPLECMLCMKLFSSVSELKGHVVAQHSYVSVKRRSDCTTRIARNNSKYVCTLCKRSFVTSTDLMVHETCHDKYACYGCRNKYDTFEQLSNHTKTCTAVQSKKQQQPKTLEDVKSTAKPPKTKAEYQKAYREREKAKKNENKQESTAKPPKTKAEYQKEYREREKAKKNENKQESTAKPPKTKAEYQKEYRERQKAKKNENKQERTAKPPKTNAEHQKAFRERQKMKKIKNKRESNAALNAPSKTKKTQSEHCKEYQQKSRLKKQRVQLDALLFEKSEVPQSKKIKLIDTQNVTNKNLL
ncbi:zinc finger protein pita isoform X5 [Bombyx mori]|uniref:Uncharacterized protein n=2 Tax=Bombyx mori TaxID=7091 RepID=A0A8R2HUM2_BOMMO|nr:uncharacterized protein LOC101744110 isoform X5 [Bombyx mori]